MATKKQKVMPIIPVVPAKNVLQSVQDQFKKLGELNALISSMKNLYAEREALITALQPLFIEVKNEEFIIKRSVTIGNKTYRYSPFFFNEKKGQIVAKVWKSTCFDSGYIES